MRNILLIAKREYLEQIRGRAFKFSTVLLPAVIGVLIAVGYFAGRPSESGKHVAIAADSRRWPTPSAARCWTTRKLSSPSMWSRRRRSDQRAVLLRQVQSKSLDGLLSITNSDGETHGYLYFAGGGRFRYFGSIEICLESRAAQSASDCERT